MFPFSNAAEFGHDLIKTLVEASSLISNEYFEEISATMKKFAATRVLLLIIVFPASQDIVEAAAISERDVITVSFYYDE